MRARPAGPDSEVVVLTGNGKAFRAGGGGALPWPQLMAYAKTKRYPLTGAILSAAMRYLPGIEL